MEKAEIRGTVEKITYRNRDNGYTVFKIRHGKKELFCVGYVPAVNEGDTITASGSYSNHPVYGEQFNVETVDISAPKTQLQVLKYLSSGAIKGIGPATAIKIVERFKEDTLDIIENYPIELCVIRGISKEKALAISEEYKKQFGMRDIFIALATFNITPIEAAEIFKVYGVHSVDLIKENPFILCIPEIGFSFERVEEISDSKLL
jgi:exodeoxyribonuclease V alpha subunit